MERARRRRCQRHSLEGPIKDRFQAPLTEDPSPDHAAVVLRTLVATSSPAFPPRRRRRRSGRKNGLNDAVEHFLRRHSEGGGLAFQGLGRKARSNVLLRALHGFRREYRGARCSGLRGRSSLHSLVQLRNELPPRLRRPVALGHKAAALKPVEALWTVARRPKAPRISARDKLAQRRLFVLA